MTTNITVQLTTLQRSLSNSQHGMLSGYLRDAYIVASLVGTGIAVTGLAILKAWWFGSLVSTNWSASTTLLITLTAAYAVQWIALLPPVRLSGSVALRLSTQPAIASSRSLSAALASVSLVSLSALALSPSLALTLVPASRNTHTDAALTGAFTSGAAIDTAFILHGSVTAALIVLIGRLSHLRSRNIVSASWGQATALETAWTAMPAIWIALLASDGLLALYATEIDYGSTSTSIKVTGRQWFWEYESNQALVSANSVQDVSSALVDTATVSLVESRYIPSADLPFGSPRTALTSQPMYVPANTPVVINITSADVLHSWSVPALGVKVDAVPGRTTALHLKGTIPGVYTGFCSELCGQGHAFMPINVVVYTPISSL